MKKRMLALTLVSSMVLAASMPMLAGAEEAGSLTGNGDIDLTVFVYAQEHEKVIYQQLISDFVAEHADEIGEVSFEVTTSDEYNTKMIGYMTAATFRISSM